MLSQLGEYKELNMVRVLFKKDILNWRDLSIDIKVFNAPDWLKKRIINSDVLLIVLSYLSRQNQLRL